MLAFPDSLNRNQGDQSILSAQLGAVPLISASAQLAVGRGGDGVGLYSGQVGSRLSPSLARPLGAVLGLEHPHGLGSVPEVSL